MRVKRIYGELIDCQNIDKKYLKKTTIHKDIETKIYQFEALHKKVNGSLNIVLIFSTNLKNKKTTHTILFSTDLEQDYEKIIDYYSLRFQIEFIPQGQVSRILEMLNSSLDLKIL